MLTHDRREIVVPVVEGIIEYLHDVRRIDRLCAGGPAGNDFLQLALADAQLVHLVLELREIVEAVQDRAQAVGQLRLDPFAVIIARKLMRVK